MLLGRADLTLRGESVQGRDDIGTRLLRLDDHVGIAALGCLVRRGKFLDVFGCFLLLVGILAEDDVRSARRTTLLFFLKNFGSTMFMLPV